MLNEDSKFFEIKTYFVWEIFSNALCCQLEFQFVVHL